MSLEQAVALLKSKSPKKFNPKIALVLGSGLSLLAERFTDSVAVPFHEIPGLPRSCVEGHKGEFVMGFLNETPVLCLNGRLHIYEGVPYSAIALLIRIVKGMGCENIIMTNSSGSLRADVGPGELMLITDHINFHPSNPLVGPNDDTVGPRFVGMDQAYDLNLRRVIHQAADALGSPIAEGTYISVLGPCFETPAEIHAFRVLRADAVGMSTVPDVIAARHCGLKVAVIAAITNFAAGMVENVELSHEHTLHHAAEAAKDLMRLVVATIGILSDDYAD